MSFTYVREAQIVTVEEGHCAQMSEHAISEREALA
jgi:hypothetical protein